jgi:hypothetical protein
MNTIAAQNSLLRWMLMVLLLAPMQIALAQRTCERQDNHGLLQ